MLNLFSNVRQIVLFFSVWIAVPFILPYKASIAQTTLSPTFEASQPNPQNLCPVDLPEAISTILSRPEFRRSRWGILVETLSTQKNLYSLESDKYFIPASTFKLLTTAAALYKFGSSWQIKTSIYRKNNTYTIVGRGDPSLSTQDLDNLARQLREKGITKIPNLVFNHSYFQTPYIPPTWEWQDINFSYAVGVNNFTLNENTVNLELLPQQLGQELQFDWSDDLAGSQWQIKNETITAEVGKPYNISINRIFGKPILEIKGELAIDSGLDTWEIAVLDPLKYFQDSFRVLLLNQGIYTINEINTNNIIIETNLGDEIAVIKSDSLTNLINITNQESNNLFAESLIQILKAELKTETGPEALTQVLTELGVNPEGYKLADGSGLSRHNLITPSALVETLKLMAQIPEADIYQNSLPLGGVSGTLKRRFLNIPEQGIVRAKTGTLTGVSALSGYLYGPHYEPLVFSIIVNQSEQSSSILRQGIDEIVLLLMNLRSC